MSHFFESRPEIAMESVQAGVLVRAMPGRSQPEYLAPFIEHDHASIFCYRPFLKNQPNLASLLCGTPLARRSPNRLHSPRLNQARPQVYTMRVGGVPIVPDRSEHKGLNVKSSHGANIGSKLSDIRPKRKPDKEIE